jgi:hypothetical protein
MWTTYSLCHPYCLYRMFFVCALQRMWVAWPGGLTNVRTVAMAWSSAWGAWLVGSKSICCLDIHRIHSKQRANDWRTSKLMYVVMVAWSEKTEKQCVRNNSAVSQLWKHICTPCMLGMPACDGWNMFIRIPEACSWMAEPAANSRGMQLDGWTSCQPGGGGHHSP